MLVAFIKGVKRNIVIQLLDIKERSKTKGLQILRVVDQAFDSSVDTVIKVLLRNDENVPLALGGEYYPISFGGLTEQRWVMTDASRTNRMFVGLNITIPPKETYVVELARTDINNHNFFIYGNPSVTMDREGYYSYCLNLSGKSEEDELFKVVLDGYFEYLGDHRLKFCRELPEGIAFL